VARRGLPISRRAEGSEILLGDSVWREAPIAKVDAADPVDGDERRDAIGRVAKEMNPLVLDEQQMRLEAAILDHLAVSVAVLDVDEAAGYDRGDE
jgi:hypothetical protein